VVARTEHRAKAHGMSHRVAADHSQPSTAVRQSRCHSGGTAYSPAAAELEYHLIGCAPKGFGGFLPFLGMEYFAILSFAAALYLMPEESSTDCEPNLAPPNVEHVPTPPAAHNQRRVP
jgi:hypothetical protein